MGIYAYVVPPGLDSPPNCVICMDPVTTDGVCHDGEQGVRHPLHRECFEVLDTFTGPARQLQCPLCKVEIRPGLVPGDRSLFIIYFSAILGTLATLTAALTEEETGATAWTACGCGALSLGAGLWNLVHRPLQASLP